MKLLLALAAVLGVGCPFTTRADEVEAIPVHITVDVARPTGPLKPVWRFFGADEPNYAYMPDGTRLLGDLGALRPDEVYFRAHNLLTTGDGTPALKWGSTNAYTEDAGGNPVYDWTIVDRIFDTYRVNHVRPYVQLGFMPKALSTRPEPYQHHWTPHAKYEEIYTGWAYPPASYEKWGELVSAWARHALDRYGAEEVSHWYWETWNEPNIPYWRGTKEEFFKLHDTSVEAVRKVIPNAKVGGPDAAGGGTQWFRDFLKHCVDANTPTDFVSFHAKGSPKFVDNHVRMGIAAQLKNCDDAFRIVASFPQLKDKPIVIGESDPDGCAACQGPQLGYRNGTMYSSYTAASIPRIMDLANKHGVNLDGVLTWAFEFEDQPAFAGFRVLATRDRVALPVLNTFRLFAKMSGQRLPVTSDGAVPLADMVKDGVRSRPDVSAIAARDGSRVAVLLWHYHDDDLAGPDASVTLKLDHITAGALHVEQFLIDRTHANALPAWQAMGSPAEPTADQTRQLRDAAALRAEKGPEAFDGSLKVTLRRQAVMLLVIDQEKAQG